MKPSLAVVIGRFQPFHRGHLELLTAAAQEADRVAIIIGSAKSARNLRNPFTADERIEMIRGNLKDTSRFEFVPIRDYFYDDLAWTNEVRSKAYALAGSGSISIVGHEKDATSSYLTWFPDWNRMEIPCGVPVHATAIRHAFLRDPASARLNDGLSLATQEWLAEFSKTPSYRDLAEEQKQIDAYKSQWAASPFPPVFVTTDAVLVCAGHVLLIQRGRSPGKGLWASPGGFLDPHERIEACAIRELYEETEIDVPESELKAALTRVRVFDHPLRSSRGRTITHAHLFKLGRDSLPRIRGADDAAAAQWVPILDLGRMETQFFEDHFYMIHALMGAR